METGKRRLAGDTARAASLGEVTSLRRKARELKEVIAEQTLGHRLLKKARLGLSVMQTSAAGNSGGDDE